MKQQKLLAAILCAVSPLSYAASDTLDEIVVTATRTAQSADATLASVSVIARQDIDRLQAQSLPDVLRGVAGLTISNNGGAGKATSVFLRGTNADHVLVLVDGIKVGSATLGTASFQDIPVAQIERIEIVRGPRASLYGSEAIGGVIQIFTRKGGGVLTPSFSVTAGSYGTVNSTAGLSGGGEQGWFKARLKHFFNNRLKYFNGIANFPCIFEVVEDSSYSIYIERKFFSFFSNHNVRLCSFMPSSTFIHYIWIVTGNIDNTQTGFLY